MADSQTPPLPTSLPVLPLRRTVAFPLTLQPLAVNRPASIESVNTALTTDRMLLLVLQTNDADEPDPAALESVGTICIVRQMARADHGLNIIFEGVARVKVVTVSKTDHTMRATIEPLPEQRDAGVETEAYVRRIRELAEKAAGLVAGASAEVRQLVLGIDDPLRLVYLLGSMLDATAAEKQAVLAADPLLKKLEIVHGMLAREISVLEVKGQIESQAQAEMSASQRQYYVGAESGYVTIFRGLPVNVGPFDLHSVEERTDLTVDSLPDFEAMQVQSTIQTDSLAAAEQVVQRLTERAAQCVSVPSTPGCPDATSSDAGTPTAQTASASS